MYRSDCSLLLFSVIFFLTMKNCWSADIDSPQCVYFNVEDCPPSTETCRCRKVEKESVYCCDINGDFQLREGLACAEVGHPSVTALHIRNATLSKLDANSDKWRHLVSLSITDSRIPRLNKVFGSESELTCLNLSNNGLSEVNPRVVQALPKLSKLDLSLNNLTELPEINVRISNFLIDIANNSLLSCQSLSEMVSRYDSTDSTQFNIHFLHENSTFCVQPVSYHWFNSTEKVPLQKIKMKSEVDKVCPRGEGYKCTCEIFRIENNYNNNTRLTFEVDCSNKKLTALPKPLPPFTVKLNVSNNNITGIDELSVDETYSNIRYFYADHNQVKTFAVLEGSKFLDDFVHLSLDHNHIKTLPIYILSNAIDRLSIDREITLGENPLLCDCTTAQVTKFWLINNKRVIRDFDNVWCENVKDKVIELEQNKVCIYQKDWSDYIHYIIAIEVFLFVLLVSKVSYDYWIFKSAGYLPWPASKMPKLPCDWVFE